jgi:hypothetical protein
MVAYGNSFEVAVDFFDLEDGTTKPHRKSACTNL